MPIFVIDGCPLQCAKHCLNNIGVEAEVNIVLTENGLKKNFHEDYDTETFERKYQKSKHFLKFIIYKHVDNFIRGLFYCVNKNGFIIFILSKKQIMFSPVLKF